jgi:hypothetical protein
MTQPAEPPYTPPPSPSPSTSRPPASPPARPRRGCGSQLLGLIGWLVTLALSAALGIAALAAIAYFIFGFDLATPGQIRQASADVAGLQGQADTLATEVAQLRTAEVEGARRLSAAAERVGELEAQVTGFEQQAAALAEQGATASALSRELSENVALAATIQAEGREGRVFLSVVATTQADTSLRVAELQRRTERITRFLERLGDLAGDVADNGAPLPTDTPPVGATAPASPAPTATPTARPTVAP